MSGLRSLYHDGTLYISLSYPRSRLIGLDMCKWRRLKARGFETGRCAAAGPWVFGDRLLRKRQLEIRWGKPLWMERVVINAT